MCYLVTCYITAYRLYFFLSFLCNVTTVFFQERYAYKKRELINIPRHVYEEYMQSITSCVHDVTLPVPVGDNMEVKLISNFFE